MMNGSIWAQCKHVQLEVNVSIKYRNIIFYGDNSQLPIFLILFLNSGRTKCNWVATVSIRGQECNVQGSHWNVTKWDKQHISYKQQWERRKKKKLNQLFKKQNAQNSAGIGQFHWYKPKLSCSYLLFRATA